jgi:hypothetical protein
MSRTRSVNKNHDKKRDNINNNKDNNNNNNTSSSTSSKRDNHNQNNQTKNRRRNNNNNNYQRKNSGGKIQYPEHTPLRECMERYAKKDKTLIRGKLRVIPGGKMAFVSCDRGSYNKDIVLDGELSR